MAWVYQTEKNTEIHFVYGWFIRWYFRGRQDQKEAVEKLQSVKDIDRFPDIKKRSDLVSVTIRNSRKIGAKMPKRSLKAHPKNIPKGNKNDWPENVWNTQKRWKIDQSLKLIIFKTHFFTIFIPKRNVAHKNISLDSYQVQFNCFL